MKASHDVQVAVLFDLSWAMFEQTIEYRMLATGVNLAWKKLDIPSNEVVSHFVAATTTISTLTVHDIDIPSSSVCCGHQSLSNNEPSLTKARCYTQAK